MNAQIERMTLHTPAAVVANGRLLIKAKGPTELMWGKDKRGRWTRRRIRIGSPAHRSGKWTVTKGEDGTAPEPEARKKRRGGRRKKADRFLDNLHAKHRAHVEHALRQYVGNVPPDEVEPARRTFVEAIRRGASPQEAHDEAAAVHPEMAEEGLQLVMQAVGRPGPGRERKRDSGPEFPTVGYTPTGKPVTVPTMMHDEMPPLNRYDKVYEHYDDDAMKRWVEEGFAAFTPDEHEAAARLHDSAARSLDAKVSRAERSRNWKQMDRERRKIARHAAAAAAHRALAQPDGILDAGEGKHYVSWRTSPDGMKAVDTVSRAGDFAIHRKDSESRKAEYVVSHIPSGLAVAYFDGKSNVRMMSRWIESLPRVSAVGFGVPRGVGHPEMVALGEAMKTNPFDNPGYRAQFGGKDPRKGLKPAPVYSNIQRGSTSLDSRLAEPTQRFLEAHFADANAVPLTIADVEGQGRYQTRQILDALTGAGFVTRYKKGSRYVYDRTPENRASVPDLPEGMYYNGTNVVTRHWSPDGREHRLPVAEGRARLRIESSGNYSDRPKVNDEIGAEARTLALEIPGAVELEHQGYDGSTYSTVSVPVDDHESLTRLAKLQAAQSMVVTHARRFPNGAVAELRRRFRDDP